MDPVWAPVIAGLFGALIGSGATLITVIVQANHETKAAKDERDAARLATAAGREAAEKAAHDQSTQQLKRDLLSAFMDGRLAIGRSRALERRQVPQHEMEPCAEDLRSAAGRLAVAGEMLAASIGTDVARKHAAELTNFAMDNFLSRVIEGIQPEQWDKRGNPHVQVQSVDQLMAPLLVESS